jgi:hypothetical protein
VLHNAHFQVACPATQLYDDRILFIGQGQDAPLGRQQLEAGSPWVANVQHLDLADHQWLVTGGCKAAAIAHQARCKAGASNNRGFFNRHRDQVIPAVDQKVGGDAQWKAKDTNDILDHMVSLRLAEAGCPGESLRFLLGQAGELLQCSDSLLGTELVEPAQSR